MAKSLFDKHAAMSVEEIIIHGYLEMSSVVLKVVASIIGGLEGDKQLVLNDIDRLMGYFMDVRDSFLKLAENNFVERTPQLESSHMEVSEQTEQNGSNGHKNGNGQPAKTKVPKFVFSEYERYATPHLALKCKN